MPFISCASFLVAVVVVVGVVRRLYASALNDRFDHAMIEPYLGLEGHAPHSQSG